MLRYTLRFHPLKKLRCLVYIQTIPSHHHLRDSGFYQMVQGNLDKDKDTKRKIIVIDDPVTSMDSSALFIVGALVREMIKVCTNSGTLLTSGFEATYIDQIFILTHNVLFHREVTMGQDSDDLYNVVSFSRSINPAQYHTYSPAS